MKKLETLHIGPYMTSCLTQVIHLRIGNTFQLLTASTDGHIALWDLAEGFRAKGITNNIHRALSYTKPRISSIAPTEISWQARTKIHQSSIKAMKTIPLSSSNTLLVTGGDDGALAFTRINFFKDNPVDPPLRSVLLIPKAHASAINAIAYLSHEKIIASDGPKEYRFATTSNDQKIKVWQLSADLDKPGVEGFQVVKKKNVCSSIADVSCLERFDTDKGEPRLIVAGIGMETWNLEI